MYPYVWLSYLETKADPAVPYYVVHMMAAPVVYSGSSYVTQSSGAYLIYRIVGDSTDWEADADNPLTAEAGKILFDPADSIIAINKRFIWSNYDITNAEDGKVYFEGSEPVPVYE